MLKVAKLVDSYLAEIAPDTNLDLPKFLLIAEALPLHARTLNVGLYRAVDLYLKAHQGVSDYDKKMLSKLIDFQKLSQEAGAHAAQNERLPLQSIVQVLYYEQLKLRSSLCSSYSDEETKTKQQQQQSWRINSGALSAAMSPKDNYASLRRENRELKLELARLRMRHNDLEKEHICMKRRYAEVSLAQIHEQFVKENGGNLASKLNKELKDLKNKVRALVLVRLGLLWRRRNKLGFSWDSGRVNITNVVLI